MQKQTNANFYPFQFGETALVASRQVWLASLGATAVTREWVQTEAGQVFKNLVKEGNRLETQAIRVVNDRLETSFAFANTAWKETRKTVEATVKEAATNVISYAERVLPKTLPVDFTRIMKPVAAKPAPAKRAVKATRTRVVKAVRKTRRTKAASKR